MEFEALTRGIYLEGLCTDADTLWVSDPIQGGIRRLRADGSVDEWLPEKRWIGSLILNRDGRILASGADGIIWLDGNTGASGVLVDRAGEEPLPGVNEMVADTQGRLYFGTLDAPAVSRGEQPGPATLYRLNTDGGLDALCTGLRFSNGLALSPDEKRLYHNESFVGTYAYDIRSDGSLGEPVQLLDKADCDGIAVDTKGTLWITGFASRQITCLRPDGALKELVEVPGGGVTNIRFGGADRRDIYLNTVPEGAALKIAEGNRPDTEASILYRTRAGVAGLPNRPADFSLPT